MILHKGKHNFWSQLLLSMIAIFALPTVQGTEHHTNNDNYQSQSHQIQQQIIKSAFLVQRVCQQPNATLFVPVEITILNHIEPLLLADYRALHAPIRAGPIVA